jgi:hypothetical protein
MIPTASKSIARQVHRNRSARNLAFRTPARRMSWTGSGGSFGMSRITTPPGLDSRGELDDNGEPAARKSGNRIKRSSATSLNPHVPGATAEMSDTDVSHLRDLVDPSARPEVAGGLIREMDTLLALDDKQLEEWMAKSAATGIRFGSIHEARAYLTQFRALLKGNLARTSERTRGRINRSSE